VIVVMMMMMVMVVMVGLHLIGWHLRVGLVLGKRRDGEAERNDGRQGNSKLAHGFLSDGELRGLNYNIAVQMNPA